MNIIRILVVLISGYLITISPEIYLQAFYAGVIAYSSFHLGMEMQKVALQAKVNQIYAQMEIDFNAKLRSIIRENEND